MRAGQGRPPEADGAAAVARPVRVWRPGGKALFQGCVYPDVRRLSFPPGTVVSRGNGPAKTLFGCYLFFKVVELYGHRVLELEPWEPRKRSKRKLRVMQVPGTERDTPSERKCCLTSKIKRKSAEQKPAGYWGPTPELSVTRRDLGEVRGVRATVCPSSLPGELAGLLRVVRPRPMAFPGWDHRSRETVSEGGRGSRLVKAGPWGSQAEKE